jgi:hypothetical protein
MELVLIFIQFLLKLIIQLSLIINLLMISVALVLQQAMDKGDLQFQQVNTNQLN